MLDRITHPEKFIDAEAKGADWIKKQKKEHAGLGEIIRSFFSLKSTDHNPMANLVFKSGSLLAGGSIYLASFLENTDRPILVGAVLLAFGVEGVGTSIIATRDSMERRGIERKRKLQRAVS